MKNMKIKDSAFSTVFILCNKYLNSPSDTLPSFNSFGIPWIKRIKGFIERVKMRAELVT